MTIVSSAPVPSIARIAIVNLSCVAGCYEPFVLVLSDAIQFSVSHGCANALPPARPEATPAPSTSLGARRWVLSPTFCQPWGEGRDGAAERRQSPPRLPPAKTCNTLLIAFPAWR